MAVTIDQVKELRERTGAGIKECRDILQETSGDINKAIALLREKGIADAGKKQTREANEGKIETYIHFGSQLAAMVEVNCETDFVARTDDFTTFAKEVAQHIAATNPLYIRLDEVPADVIASSELSPEKYAEQYVLLAQPYVRDPSQTIEDRQKAAISKLGENIVIRRFIRYKIGE